MEQLTEDSLPPELRAENYSYPVGLFRDWKKRTWEKKQKVLQFDGGDPVLPPVTNSEQIVLMARYALVRSLKLPFGENRAANIARCEIEAGFMASLFKARHNLYESYAGLEKGDVELAAEELGVYEIVWPFDPTKMQQAEETECALHEGLVPAH